jgi:hypothetical protein
LCLLIDENNTWEFEAFVGAGPEMIIFVVVEILAHNSLGIPKTEAETMYDVHREHALPLFQ